MAVYNGFPATYQPMYPYTQSYTPVQVQPQSVAPVQSPAQPSQSSIIWVSGEAGAKAYLVAPNNTVQLWDSEAQVIYLKSADASGMPSMKVLDYTIRENGRNGLRTADNLQPDKSITYATKAELEAVLAQISALRDQVNGKEIQA